MASEPVPGRENGRTTLPAESAALLYERYRDRVFGYCLYMLGNRDEADDATQTTFLHAFRALRRGVVPAIEAAWLLKIAENVCLSWRRSAARRKRVEAPGDVIALEEVVPAPERRADELIGLEDALSEMPETQRNAILLREWQGLSYREIADRLRISQTAVETLLFRARRTLAKNLTVPQTTRRRVARVLDFGALAGAIKSALAGGSAVKVAATIAAMVTATAVVGSTALGDREPVEKESQKEIDVVAAPKGASLDSPSLEGRERVVVSEARAAVRDRAAGTDGKQRGPGTTVANQDGAGSPSTASADGGAQGGSSSPSEPTGSSGTRLTPPSPPSLTVPSVPPPPGTPLEPPSLPLNPPTLNPPTLPLNPPTLPLNPPTLPPAPLPPAPLPSLPPAPLPSLPPAPLPP